MPGVVCSTINTMINDIGLRLSENNCFRLYPDPESVTNLFSLQEESAMLHYPAFSKPAALGQRDIMIQHLTQLSQQDQVSFLNFLLVSSFVMCEDFHIPYLVAFPFHLSLYL